MKKMNMKIYRFSLFWSDIQPNRGEFNRAAIGRYADMVYTLKKNKIEPMVTLWHFEHPEWLEAEGGPLSDSFVEMYSRYVKYVVEELRGVKYWITVNEPNIYGICTHILCSFPCTSPGFSIKKAHRIISNLLMCHVNAYNIISRTFEYKVNISFAINVQPFWPEHKYSLIETQIAELVNQFNYIIFDAIETGIAKFTFAGVTVFQMKVCDEKIPLDFISINHYNGQWVTLNWKHWDGIPLLSMQSHIYETSDFNWCVAYDSLASTVRWVNDRWNKNNLDIVITENGISDKSDRLRRKHLQLTLLFLKNAMKKYDLPVTKYIHWSLLDNYEWADGYSQHFGLIGIEPDEVALSYRSKNEHNKEQKGEYKRVPRQSAEIYMKIAAQFQQKKMGTDEVDVNIENKSYDFKKRITTGQINI
jgi:beta-glucosidase